MSLAVAECGYPVVISTATTTTVSVGPCQCLGFYVASTSSGTVIVKDGSNAISGTITPVIGWHAFPADIGSSLVITTANTINMTVFWAAAN